MTKEALQEQHRMIIGLNNGSSEDATKLSIEYAIGVLEDILADVLMPVKSKRGIQDKIEELKSLLK